MKKSRRGKDHKHDDNRKFAGLEPLPESFVENIARIPEGARRYAQIREKTGIIEDYNNKLISPFHLATLVAATPKGHDIIKTAIGEMIRDFPTYYEYCKKHIEDTVEYWGKFRPAEKIDHDAFLTAAIGNPNAAKLDEVSHDIRALFAKKPLDLESYVDLYFKAVQTIYGEKKSGKKEMKKIVRRIREAEIDLE